MPRRLVTSKVALGLLNSDSCAIVFFRTLSCPHCVRLAKKVEDLLTTDQTNIEVYDACPDLGTPVSFFEKFGITSVPHLVIMKGGEILALNKKSGCCEHLRLFIKKALQR